MRSAPREGWILAGALDGRPAAPGLLDDIAGLPNALRIAGELALAGVDQITVVWLGAEPPPDLAVIARDPRLASRAQLTVATAPPDGPPDDGILVVRADRVFHRDLPKQAAAVWRSGAARVGKIAGAEHDAVFAADRALATALVARTAQAGGLTSELNRLEATGQIAAAELPYLGFTAAAPDARALRRAERRLVWSLRKAADGVAAKLINRRLSLPVTWLLARAPVHPNHITIAALCCAIAGGIVIGTGGYWSGVVGMLFVELGSIIDGVDGELARLRHQFSRLGQWLDTVADDLGNFVYSTGVMIHLDAAGVAWAIPLGAAALGGFAITQIIQYYLIARVYRSGDLAAIPWAFQSAEFLAARPRGALAWVRATAPKLLKRDFAITLFTVLALCGRLDVVLLVFSSGALAFFAAFMIQLIRNWTAIRARRAAPG